MVAQNNDRPRAVDSDGRLITAAIQRLLGNGRASIRLGPTGESAAG